MANIDGTSGDDTLNGTSGDDVITGFDGDDTIDGLGGNDTISGGAGADAINGGDGVDVLYSDTTSPLLGSGSDPILDHGTEIDTLVAGDGEDFLFAGYGDSADGGAGNDTLYVSFFAAPSGVTFDANLATQTIGGGTITGIENISWLEGSNYDDNFNLNSDFDTGLPGNARIYALSGNDVVIAGYSTWLIDGGAGNDTLDGRNSAYLDEIQGGTGNDTIYGSTRLAGGNIELNGGAGDDTIIGGTADELLVGGDGNDSITDGAGSDHVDAGAGSFDSIYASVDYSNDIFDGGDGTHDIVYFSNALAAVQANLTTGTAQSVAGEDAAGIGVDQLVNIEDLYGSAFDDILTGDAGDNGLFGRDGNDVLNGGAGDDTMVGGLGNDVYHVDSAGDAIIENPGEGIDSVLSSSTYTLSANMEKLTLTGSSASWGYGNDIANTLTGNSANNKLFGFEGNDTLNGKAGDDTMAGGLGNDKYYVDSTSDRIIEQANEGTDSVLATASYRLSGDVERLTLTGTGDTYGYGNGIGNVLTGNSGANQLSGLGGNDLINGVGGDDRLFGGSGADQLKGGEGSDWIEGGAERDLLYGNLGADVFVFRDGDFGHTQSTADRIMDFHSDQADSIDLHVVDANILLDGNQAFSFIGTNAFSHTAGELRYVEAGAATFVCGDMDGDGISDLMIRLDGSHSLSVGDFVL